MAKKSEINKKGRLAKSTLSVVLAASMVLTSSSFVWASPVNDISIVEEGDDVVTVPAEESVAVQNLDVADEQTEEVVGAVAPAKDAADFEITFEAATYNGKEQKPSVTVNYEAGAAGSFTAGKTLVDSANYKVDYYNNTNAGTAKATITFITEEYEATTPITKDFTIAPADISGAEVVYGDVDAFIYNGAKQAPEVKSVQVTLTGDTTPTALVKDVDYTVEPASGSYDLISAKAQQIVLKGKGNYDSSTKTSAKDYTIQKAVFDATKMDVKVDPIAYNSANDADTVKGAVTVTEKSTGLDFDDFDVKFLNASGEWVATIQDKNIGSHPFRIVSNSADNYEDGGYIDGTYEIVGTATLSMKLNGATITGYTGTAGEGFTVAYDGTDKFKEAFASGLGGLSVKDDFEFVTPKAEWINAGEYKLVVEGRNLYAGQTLEIPVTIAAKKLTTDGATEATDINVAATVGKTHSGQEASATVVVTDGATTLENGKDYTYVTRKVGNVTKVDITGIGNYTTEWANGSLLTKDADETETLNLNHESISVKVNKSFAYTGSAITLSYGDIEVIENDTVAYTLGSGDFYVKSTGYENNTDPGTATATLVGRGKYDGEREIEFTITGDSFANAFYLDTTGLKASYDNSKDNATDISGALKVRYKANDAVYSSNGVKYDVKFYYENEEKTTATVEKAGTYTVKVTPKASKYEGSLETTVKVIGKDISGTAKVADISDQDYTGKAIEPEVKVSYTSPLVKDKDYKVSYDSNTDVGTAYVTVEFMGDYSGKIVKSFKILGTDISKATVAVDGTYNYTGEAVIPTVIVKLGDTVIDAADYDVKATDNVNAGTAKVAVTGKGGFTGTTKEVTFEIGKADQKLSISKTQADALKIRNTNANSYTLKVTGAETKLTYKSSDTKVASVSAAGKISFKHVCGKATITVTAAADENHNAATLKVAVAVKPATPKITITARAKGFNAKATTVKDITGYQVGYSTDKNFAASKTTKKLVKTTKALNKNFSGLSAKKGYYVRVRAYKIASNGTVYWGNWTSAKKITTK